MRQYLRATKRAAQKGWRMDDWTLAKEVSAHNATVLAAVFEVAKAGGYAFATKDEKLYVFTKSLYFDGYVQLTVFEMQNGELEPIYDSQHKELDTSFVMGTPRGCFVNIHAA